MATELTTVEIDPKGEAQASVIWMHGLGADAHDFEPIIPYLKLPPELGVRFVFPNAQIRPVTINGGMRMRAWYDILSLDIPRDEDDVGIRDSEASIITLIQQERQRGITADKIIIAGFSQGGAMALHTGLRYPETLAGILALSCYLPLAKTVADERHNANQNTPIFIAHGSQDAVVPLSAGKSSLEQLQKLAYQIDWHEYGMGHEVSLDEIGDIGAWLRTILQHQE